MAFAACPVMERDYPSAFWASIYLFLVAHERIHAVQTDIFAMFHKARLISLIVTFLQILDQLAGKIDAFKTILQLFVCDAGFYPARTTVLWFSCIVMQAACTWLPVVAVLVADHAVHSAGGEHARVNGSFRHFHESFSAILHEHCITSKY